MRSLITADQMRDIEAAAIGSGRASGLELMERAGQGVVDAVLAHWPEYASGAAPAAGGARGPAPSGPADHSPPEFTGPDEGGAWRCIVFCGPGNNGGDGLVVARLLAGLGWAVEVVLFGELAKLPADAQTNYLRWHEIGPVVALEDWKARQADLLVDAFFGTGLKRAMPAACITALQEARAGGARLVAVDCPSGIECDSGIALRSGQAAEAVLPDLCVTFHAAKVGHYLQAQAHVPPVVVDIGLTAQDAEQIGEGVRCLDVADEDASDWVRSVSLPFLSRQAHKYDRGHALILGGGAGHGGAARLAARAALRIGAGLVTVAVPSEALAENAARLDAVMLRAVDDAPALADQLSDPRIGSVCIGPGFGVGPACRAAVGAVLASQGAVPGRHVVLDADALTSFQDHPEALFERLSERVVLTPHEGEFARLFPDLAEKMRNVAFAPAGASKVDVVRVAAKRAGCVVLLKGPATVIASPGGRASIHPALYDRAVPWLGTAGAGDVLAGMITGVLAPQTEVAKLHDKVEVATYLHAEAARAFGPGLIAEDLPDQLPAVFRALGIGSP